MLGGDGRSFDQRQKVALHAFAGDVGSASSFRARGDLVDLIDKYDAVLLDGFDRLASLDERTLPDGVRPRLGPDATAMGQVFWYTLEGWSEDQDPRPVGGFGLDELRSIQDWVVRPALAGVEGVAEVASIGGFVREFLQGEVGGNDADDNGNGLSDERGLCMTFDTDTNTLMVRLTIERLTSQGRLVTSTAETSVLLRND